MYAGAQRVRNRERAGINTFLYMHGSSPIPITSAGYPDLDEVANHQPGRLVRTLTDVPRGGNDVLSFLDVVAPDAIATPELTHHLEHASAEVAMTDLPKIWYVQAARIAIKFWALNLSGEPARQEYDALKRRLLHILTGDHVVTTDSPFDARLIKRTDAYELIWTPPAKARLIAAGFQPVASLRLAYDVVDQWKASELPGPLVAHCLAAMANTDLHELVRRGGVRVLTEDEEIVWKRLTS